MRAINDEDDYVKAGNYWRWLKKKLNANGIQLVSITHDFKFQAPDGKQRFADALDSDCVQTLAKHYPNKPWQTALTIAKSLWKVSIIPTITNKPIKREQSELAHFADREVSRTEFLNVKYIYAQYTTKTSII